MNSQERFNKKSRKKFILNIKDFWLKYESKILLTIGLILAVILAFQAGVLSGQKWQSKPLVIEKPVSTKKEPQTNRIDRPTNRNTENKNTPDVVDNEAKINPQNSYFAIETNCAFVGSKNSNKYHVPSCPYAKRIKSENLVCFSSAEDAGARNYQPDKTCIK